MTVALREGIEPSFSGTAFANNALALEQLVGPVVMAEAVASLDEGDRSLVLDAYRVPWVPMPVHERLIEALARCSGRDGNELADAGTRGGAERAFKSVWRLMVHFESDDETLVSRTDAIYARTRNAGTLRSRVHACGNAEAELTGWSTVSDRQLRTLAIGIESVLRLAGRVHARVLHERTPEGGRFAIRWNAGAEGAVEAELG